MTTNDIPSLECLVYAVPGQNIYKQSFADAPVGMMIVDENAGILDANQYLFDVFNQDKHIIRGEQFGNVFHCYYAEKENAICGTAQQCEFCSLRRGMGNVLTQKEAVRDLEIEHTININSRIAKKWLLVNASPLIRENKTFALVSFVDITHRKRLETQLKLLGITDELTGLYNRRYILQELSNRLEARLESPLSIALIDLDHFKQINDTLGHAAGDQVLVQFSNISHRYTRYTDSVGRYGGDEFLFILPSTEGMVAIRILERIKKAFSKATSCAFSAGVLCIRSGGANQLSTSALIEQADSLLYQSKNSGRNQLALAVI